MLRNWLANLRTNFTTLNTRNRLRRRPSGRNRRQAIQSHAAAAVELLEDRTLLSSVSIDDVTLSEGDSGTTNAMFTVTLASDVAGGFTVDFDTQDGTATTSGTPDTGGDDYESNSGTLTFAGDAGETQTFSVEINGDNTVELDETFLVNLSNATNGVTIADGQGQGTITNDDSATISIADASIVEGDSGTTTLNFGLTLSNPVDLTISVDAATADDLAAVSDNDYTAADQQVNITAGTTSLDFSVELIGDTKFELDETFFVNLSNISAGGRAVSILDAQAIGTILDDDGPPVVNGDTTPGQEDDDFVVFADGIDVVVTRDGVEVFRGQNNALDVSQLVINGLDGDDSLTVDFFSGNPIRLAGIAFDGGSQSTPDGDSIVLVNGSATTVTHNLDSSSAGSIDVDGAVITYTGLEPITDNLNAANRVFDFTTAGLTVDVTSSPVTPVTHTRIDSNASELVDFTTPTGSLTINLADGTSNTINVTSLANDYNTPANFINLGDAGDVANFERTTGSLVISASWTVTGDTGNDTVNISPTNQLLDFLLGGITFDGGAGSDTLNVSDQVNIFDDTYFVTNASLDRLVWGGATYANLEFVNLFGGTGDNTFVVSSTATGATTFLQGLDGNDTFSITGSGLAGDNEFEGNAGNDTFNLNIDVAAATVLTADSLRLEGNANTVGDRDVLNINETADFARTLTSRFDGTLPTVAGFGTAIRTLDLETTRYNGAGANNDTWTYQGSIFDEEITVAPIDANAAIVFNGGDPFDGPPEVFADSLPGIAGGGFFLIDTPDYYLDGLVNATGLTIVGGPFNSPGNRLYVYGESETGLVDPVAAGVGDDPFGFGPGFILPAVPVPDSYDDIVVSDTSTAVDGHVVVNYNTTDFQQTLPNVDAAVVINAGEETTNPVTPPADADADVITLNLSPNYMFQVNGSDPDPATTGVVPPSGDELVVPGTFDTINVYSNKNPGGDPVVTVEYPDTGLLPFSYSSIEQLPTFNATTVNLIGDNNDPAIDQNDNFVVVGQDVDGDPTDGGENEFSLVINGSQPLFFNNVQFLNVFGDDQNPPPGVPSAGNDIDTLDITPYADDTPRGWGIDVFFNEGNPAGTDGDQADLLIYNTSVFGGNVSENIVVQPSGPDNGEVRVTNATDDSAIVTINYVANTDIIVNDNDGSLNDTDTLTLRGTNPDNPQTSGDDAFQADFTNAGTVAEPMVTVTDAVGSATLYRLRNFTNLNTINLAGLAGDDRFDIVGRDDGSLTVNVDGGLPDGSDTLGFDVTTGNDSYTVTPGASDHDGVALVGLNGTATPTTVNFTNVVAIDIDLLGMHASSGDDGDDAVTLDGTGGDDTFTLAAFDNDEGLAQVNGGPTIRFNELVGNFGTGTGTLTINALGGDDDLAVDQSAAPSGWQITSVVFNAGPPSSSDSFQLLLSGFNDALVYSATGANSGTLDVTNFGFTTTYTLANVESASVDADGGAGDTLDVATANATITPGSARGEGVVDPVDASGNPLLSLSYAGVETAVVTGATAVIQGTSENDTITVSAAGIVTVTNELGFNNSVDVSGFDALVINALGGDDVITIDGGAAFADGIRVLGGDNGSGSDELIVTADVGVAENVRIEPTGANFTDQLITGLGGGTTVTADGVELIDYSGNGNDDVLEVFTGFGATARLDSDPVPNTDRLVTDSLPEIQFAGLATFRIEVNGTNDYVTAFSPEGLFGANTYEVESQAADHTLVIEGTGNSDLWTITDPAGAGRVEIDTGNRTITDVDGNLDELVLRTLGGADTVTVTNTGGLVTVPIHFDGGTGSDSLVLNGTTAIDNATYNVGPNEDQGSIVHLGGNATQTITFTGLEPVLDLVTTATLTVNATNADNAINYTDAGNGNGLVSVDGFETIEFSNKTNLVINGLAGSDEINLNNPNTPTDLTSITVNGGDPTASDTVIVNGTAGTDTITFTPTAADAGTIQVNAGPVVNLATVEHLTINGQGGDDELIIETPASSQTTLTPGATDDSGDIQVDGLLPMAFTNLGTFGGLQINSAGNGSLVYRGTDGDDVFQVDSGAPATDGQVRLNSRIAVETADVTRLTLQGLSGDDHFAVRGSALPPYTNIELQGGDPDGTDSDEASFSGDGTAIIVNSNTAGTSVSGGGLAGFLRLEGVEKLQVDANDGDFRYDTLSGGANQVTVSHNATSNVTIESSGVPVVVDAFFIGDLTVDTDAGDDLLIVNGTTDDDTIDVTGSLVAVAGHETVNYVSVESLRVNGREGRDTFNVTASGIDVSILGGDPIGQLQQPVGDILNVITGGAAFTFLPGPEPDSGTVAVNGSGPISFDEIELLQINGVNHILPDRFDDPDLVFPGNDSIATATDLGSEPTVIERRLTLHDTGAGINEDFFQITAHDTGKMIFNVFFVDAVGDIDIQVQDASGDVIASATSATDNEQIVIPVVNQETYFLRVFSADGMANIYNLEIENFAAPVPDRIHLDPASDTGWFNNDQLTGDTTPRFIIQADLQNFADMGIAILTADQALMNLADAEENPFPGAAVEVHIISATTGLVHDAPVGAADMLNISGFADPIGVSNILFDFEPTTPLADDTYFVTAAVRIFDGQIDPDADGRSQLSEPLWLTIDATPAKGMVLQKFTADLTGDQEVPNPTGSLAGGDAALWLNPANDRLEMVIELAGLDLDGLQTPNDPTDDVLGLHIHRAAPGVNGPVVFGLINPNNDLNGDLIIDAANGRISSAWDLNEGNGTTLAAELANLLAGDLYFNVHTGPNPGGEIRGQIGAAGGTLKLLQSSDTGMSVIDGVTNLRSPAFVVKGEATAKVRIFARNTLTGSVNLVGSGSIGSDSTDGVLGNGFGLGEITVEPMADGSYEFFAEFEDLAGNVSRHYDFAAADLPVAIPDLSTVDVPIEVQHLFGNIADIDVKLDITHTFDADLDVFLISPNGTMVELFTDVGAAGDNFTGTVLDDQAGTSITAGVAPFTGRFQPEGLLADFNGEAPNGTWILRITDDAGVDVGMVNDVHLCIQTDRGLPVEIDTLEPNTAFLDLAEASDLGRHDDDNVTNDNTPDVTITTTDPNSAFHTLFTDNLKFRIYDRFEGAEEFLLYDSRWDGPVDAMNTIGDNFTALQFILETLPEQYAALIGTNDAVLAGGILADGIHNLKLEVEDRAGNISHDFLSNVLVDTAAPPVAFGLKTAADDGLKAGDDSGLSITPETLVDRITNVTNPTFWGRAEADSIVRAFLDVNGNGAVDGADIFLGQDTAIPIDGDDAEPDGYWEIMSVVDLNDANVLAALGVGRDGLREILVTAEDVAGNVNEPDDLDNCDDQQLLQIFLDTQGPQVHDPDAGGPQQAIQVVTNGVPNTTFELFDIKPTIGPTPRVDGLLINILDQPARIAEFLYDALLTGNPNHAENPGHYSVVGDRVGNVPIASVDVTIIPPVAGQPATATIQLNFSEPLEDDRFTLTIRDSLVDPAINGFDGESNAVQPTGNPTFPSGDGNAGGSFSARFTVDSRAEIGVHGQVGITIDANGNFIQDPTVSGGTDIDLTRDLVFQFGLQTDAVFAGQFTPPGVGSNGYDRLGAYGLENGGFRFLLDFNDNGVVDAGEAFPSNVQANALPLAGDFDNDDDGDEIGLFNGGTWWLDTNGDNIMETSFTGNMRGLPIAGDFDGDGLTDLGSHLASSNTFFFDLAFNGLNGNSDRSIAFGFPGVLERPFAADFNIDGIDDIGLTTPSQTGSDGPLEWYILISQGIPETGWVNTLDHPFSPTPVGGDFAGLFGSGQQVPVVGNFDPPLDLPIVPPNIAGSYTYNGLPLQVQQNGLSLTFINEHGNASAGTFVSETQVVANGWGGLVGDLVNGNIHWANGTVWTNVPMPVPSISGAYSWNGRPLEVWQSGSLLTFVNDVGMHSEGEFLSPTQVIAHDWEGLVGNLVDGNIVWVNGLVWSPSQAASSTPDISGGYTWNGHPLSVQQAGSSLTFINDSGHQSSGSFLNNAQVIADDWGGLVGDLINGNIHWANGVVWTNATPQIAGSYVWNGHPLQVIQNGSSLTFINDSGHQSSGTFLNSSQVIAHDWGGLVGNLVNGAIQWTNGVIWTQTGTSTEAPDISGDYIYNGSPLRVWQSGPSLTFINDSGHQSSGSFLNSSQVIAHDWDGLVGNIVGDDIHWANGVVWSAASNIDHLFASLGEDLWDLL